MMTDANMDDLINKVHCLEFSEMCARLPDKSIDMILADLPYGTTALKDTWDVPIPFDVMWSAFKRIIKPRGAIVLTASQPFTSALVMSNLEWFHQELIWVKQHPKGFLDASRKHLDAHETVIVFCSKLPYYNPQNTKRVSIKSGRINKGGNGVYNTVKNEHYIQTVGNYPRSVLYFDAITHNNEHPTQKPTDLFSYLIRTYTLEGQLVFDPCVGSGTTALASVNTGRNFICSDFTQEYVDIANQRLERADPYLPTRVSDTEIQLSLLGLLND